MKKLQFFLLTILLTGLSACSGDTWDGIVFTDRDNLLMYRSSGAFESREECENASMAMLESLNVLDKGFYECGKNCKAGSSSYNRGCEETERGNFYR